MNCTAHDRPWCFRQDCIAERHRAVAARAAASSSGAATDDILQRVLREAAAGYDPPRIHGATLGFDPQGTTN